MNKYYRQLEAGDVRESGDLVIPVTSIRKTNCLGSPVGTEGSVLFLRLVEKPECNSSLEWIDDRLPTEEDCDSRNHVFVCDYNDPDGWDYEYFDKVMEGNKWFPANFAKKVGDLTQLLQAAEKLPELKDLVRGARKELKEMKDSE